MSWSWNATLRVFAAGAIGCNVLTLVVLFGRYLGIRQLARFREWLITTVALPLAAIAASAATLGSLALSEIGPYVPCRYCWFQRIGMYPVAVILVIAWVVRDRKAWRYAVPLAGAGVVVSIWHYLIQRFPDLEGAGGSCDVHNPCTLTLTWQFRFISIPYMAGSVFALVLALLISNALASRRQGV